MIQVTGLTKHYGATTAVDDLSFEVRPGQVTGFLGPNGSGKSTTMRMIVGLAAPDAGRVLIDGHPYHALASPLREVGTMLDGRAFHPGRSARDHLRALARANAIPRRRVGEVLEMVGLANVAQRRAGTFSLGMGQRLGMAAALLGDPGNLLLDEPVNGLDPEGIRWVRDLARRLAAEGRSVLISSHLISEMALTADELVIVGRGRLLTETSMAELAASRPGAVRVRTPEPDRLLAALRAAGVVARQENDGALTVTGAAAHVVADLAAAQGISLDELASQAVSLEEVFMELTKESVEYRATGPATNPPSTRNHQ